MQPTVTVDSSQANLNMIKLARAVGVEANELVRGEARMVARDLIRLTPPFGTSRRSYLQGLRATTNDFTKAVRPLREAAWKNEGIKRAIRNQDVSTLRTIFSRSASLKGKSVEHFNKQLHRGAQNNRYRILNGRAHKVITPNFPQWHQRLKELQSRVGWMKGAWAVSFLLLGGRSVPSWIRKHTSANREAVTDLRGLLSDAPTVVIGTRNKGAKKQMGYNVSRAVSRAGNRMYDKFIKIMLGHKWDMKNGVVRIHKPKQEGFSA